MDLKQFFELLKRHWWLLILTSVIAGATAYYGSKQLTPIYSSSTTVLINQTQSPGVIQYNDVLTSERLTGTYAELVKRRPILSEVKRQLALTISEEQLAAKIKVVPIRNTQLLRISAEDPSPERAAELADYTAQAFISDNSRQLGSRPGTVSIAEQANVPSSPARPDIKLNTMIAVVLGLMIGGAIGLVLEYMDDTVKSAQDVEARSGLTTLGTVTRFAGTSRGGRKRNYARGLDPGSAEDYRQIRTNIHFSMLGMKSKSILITSANPGEGKTTTAANLAAVLAQAGHSVILVDTDLRRPSLHTYFESLNSFGLTGLLLSESEDIEAGLVNTSVKGLRLLPSGPLPPNPSEILMSPEVHRLMELAKAKADYLIMDSPPILAVTDARILAGYTEATILVVEPTRTRTEAFDRSREALRQANARIVGVVLNKMHQRRRGKSNYYGYYRSSQPETGLLQAQRKG